MKNTKLLLLFFILLGLNKVSYAATCNATVTGNWSNPAIWSGGSVPTCGDFINIPAGITVHVDVHVNLAGCGVPNYIEVSGTLNFSNGQKMDLACGSGVEIIPGGKLVPGPGGGSSNWLTICGVELWKTSDGIVNGYKLFGTLNPLPVEFIAFSVEKKTENFDFSWSVASERENDYFTLDYSLDGSNWNQFVQVNSIGDHTNGYVYTKSVAIDVKVGAIYFRLSQTDKNGEITLLDIKSFENNLNEVLLYPNPAILGEGLVVALNSTSEELTEILLLNSIGQVVYNEVIQLKSGMNHITINPTNITRGVYFVKITSISGTDLQRLIIK